MNTITAGDVRRGDTITIRNRPVVITTNPVRFFGAVTMDYRVPSDPGVAGSLYCQPGDRFGVVELGRVTGLALV